jgi:hypothetical protein
MSTSMSGIICIECSIGDDLSIRGSRKQAEEPLSKGPCQNEWWFMSGEGFPIVLDPPTPLYSRERSTSSKKSIQIIPNGVVEYRRYTTKSVPKSVTRATQTRSYHDVFHPTLVGKAHVAGARPTRHAHEQACPYNKTQLVVLWSRTLL